MTTSSFIKTVLVIVFVISLFLLHVQAAELENGDKIDMTGYTIAVKPELKGLILEDLIQPFVIGPANGDDINGDNVFGTLQTRVIREDVDGTLSFYFRIQFDQGLEEKECCLKFITSNFKGFQTEVGYRKDGIGDNAPVSAYRTKESNEVSFEFADLLSSDRGSYFFFVRTTAIEYDKEGVGKIGQDEDNFSKLTIFQPTVSSTVDY